MASFKGSAVLVTLQLVGLFFLGSMAVVDVDTVGTGNLPPPAKGSAIHFPPPPPPAAFGVAVEGMIYCMRCRLPGYNHHMNASPLPGVVAKLQCNESTRYGATVKGSAMSDGNGYFFIMWRNANPSPNAMKQCKVVLTLPLWCNKPYYPNPGTPGFPLQYERTEKIGSTQWALFTAGFYEFAPYHTAMCPRPPKP